MINNDLQSIRGWFITIYKMINNDLQPFMMNKNQLQHQLQSFTMINIQLQEDWQ